MKKAKTLQLLSELIRKKAESNYNEQCRKARENGYAEDDQVILSLRQLSDRIQVNLSICLLVCSL